MKGGYKIKEGFYIKDDCKNSEEEGMIDEDGFILDPVTFEKIPKSKLIQLSDGYCYDKRNASQLLNVINRSKRLPFGHDIKSDDRRKLRSSSSSSESSIKSLLSSIPVSLESPPSPLSPLQIIESLSPEEILNAPQNLEIQNVPEEPALRPRRNRPRLIIESSSPEEVNVINQNQGRVHWSPDSQGHWVRRIIPTNQVEQPLVIESPEEIEIIPRRRTRRTRRTRRIRGPPERRQPRTRRPLLIIDSSSPEIIAEESDPFGHVSTPDMTIEEVRERLGRGTKRRTKKHKGKKSKRKSKKHHK